VRTDLTSKNVRFWPVGSYLVVYRDHPDGVQIVAVLHGSRDVPSVLDAR
jgi:plasmid stabilization system protein ParE